MCVDSTHMRVIFVLKGLQTCACSLGLCIYCYQVIQHAAYQNHTHECAIHNRAGQNRDQICLIILRYSWLVLKALAPC
jgi:hypothetical protein